ncbi:hypothetical protein ALC53_03013 [Atta colombica]|uniref:Uncharacterized protein n=2 Tax=Attini TaxID=143999 RepID=A0A195BPU5_9HYME|nr:hypothetical protein ALC53_03013 [Atta colombica]KYN09031.1 hypothetical protein ALC57_18998 [Trachymyrmex cornetzi]
MPGFQRRQMMQPWPLCLPPFAKTKITFWMAQCLSTSGSGYRAKNIDT